ncbi:hypothetical protein BO71DRAFT_441651 [Aspergillus ellipticus CBS 707.79]|uniref:Uncharacterized protein n=1 Tax=Aspergillus ellipticus CBS 707.79 TaxID=1448320 RepID=A0A319D8B8_9EURO|nr:hypothetical protein BO71DRAFT_441651 [Aspergillus ellipticus CBS 707.79]
MAVLVRDWYYLMGGGLDYLDNMHHMHEELWRKYDWMDVWIYQVDTLLYPAQPARQARSYSPIRSNPILKPILSITTARLDPIPIRMPTAKYNSPHPTSHIPHYPTPHPLTKTCTLDYSYQPTRAPQPQTTPTHSLTTPRSRRTNPRNPIMQYPQLTSPHRPSPDNNPSNAEFYSTNHHQPSRRQ